MKTVISVKVDKDVRDKAKKTAAKMGVPLSMVINTQLRRFSEEQRIEFSVPEVPNTHTARILRETLEDIRRGRTEKFSPVFSSAKDAIRWLRVKK